MKFSLVWRSVLIVGIVLILVWMSLQPGFEKHKGESLEGRPMPSFKLQDLDGNWVTQDAYQEKLKIFTFWASWCVPCVMEMPSLDKLYQKYKSQGLVVVGINVELERALGKIQLFVDRNHISFPILRDPFEKASRAFGVTTSIPHNFVIDHHGKVLKEERVAREWDTPETYAWIEELLAGHQH